MQEAVADELQQIERKGIIEKIYSLTCVSNSIVVKKKIRGIRVSVGLVNVNKAITLSSYPLPTFDELSRKLYGSKFCTKLDSCWPYVQCLLGKESCYLTAFVTANGVYQFK